MTDEHNTEPLEGGWLVTKGSLDYKDGKAPTQAFGGWPSGDPSDAWNADPDHPGTLNLGKVGGNALARAREEAEAERLSVFLLDVKNENLGVVDFDYEPDGDGDRANGKWADRGRMVDFVEEHFPEGTVWETQNKGLQVPVKFTDDAFEAVYENRVAPGHGVDSLKGPAAKGYTAAPLTPGYGVHRSHPNNEVPVLGLDDIERSELFELSQPESRSPDPSDFEPTHPPGEARSADETEDMGLLLSAINSVGPDDFRLRSKKTKERDDSTHFDPSWRSSQTNESLAYLFEQGVFQDLKKSRGMFADKLVAIEEGIIPDVHSDLEGADWWEAVERLRERGAPIPEWSGPEPEWAAELEPAEAMRGGGDEGLLWELREDYRAQMRAAVDEGVNGHLVGPKGVGKTYNSVALAAEEDVDVAVLAPTKEKYREILEEAEDHGIDALRLPSFPEHSPLWEDWEPEYLRGALPREIYDWDGREPGAGDEYKRRQGEDFSEYDLLVGAPQHAFLESVVEGRVVIFDDAELGAYRQRLDRGTKDDINRVLESVDAGPNSWKDLFGADWGPIERAVARHVARDVRDSSDVWGALDERCEDVDGIDRRRFLAKMRGVSLDVVDWMRALTGHLHTSEAWSDRGMRLVSTDGEHMLVRAPDLAPARQVFTMGAVPATEQLRAAFDDMNVEYDGMYGSARHGDMERAINRFVIQTSEHVHNKSSGYADPERLEAIRGGVEALGVELGVGEDAVVFSTKNEVDELGHGENYGSLIGTNRHSDRHLAVVGGSQHFGDTHVKLEAAYAGADAEDPVSDGPFQPRRWEDPTHAAIEHRMRTGGSYEAITRLGRSDTRLTLVAADTAELPEWLQVVDQSDRVARLSPSALDLLEHIRAREGAAFIRDGEGGGAAEVLDYSKVALYGARDELMEADLIEKVTEGKYGADGFELLDNEPVNPDIIGLRETELTGSEFSRASNPDWPVERLRTASSDTKRAGQTTITGASRGG